MKKGFTLVELLVSIVVLTIILGITIPIAMNIIKSVEKSSTESSAKGLIRAAENYYAEHLGSNAYTVFEFEDGKQISTEKLDYDGTLKESGQLVLTVEGDVSLCITNSKFYATKKPDEDKVVVEKITEDTTVRCDFLPDRDDLELIIDKVDDEKQSDGTCETNYISVNSKYYESTLNGAYPELYTGMIPIVISDNGSVTVADVRKEWYSYKNHRWANAVLVDYNKTYVASKYFNDDMTIKKEVIGKEINADDILQYYVWMPRYKYKLWNAENGTSNPQNIEIIFENKNTTKSKGSKNGQYLTHPAFTFGETELNGIWIGKFEASGTIQRITMKPYTRNLNNINLSTMFYATRNMENMFGYLYGIDSKEIDTHMMKNMEWGAMAYLSSSKYGRYDYTEDGEELADTCENSGGCEIWINPNTDGNNYSYYVGCAGASVSASYGGTCYQWYTTQGIQTSTTGNTTGIYDTSGGAYEYVMAYMNNFPDGFYAHSTGFLIEPEAKYIDKYAYGTFYYEFYRSKLGDAIREVISTKDTNVGAWNKDYSYLPTNGAYYLARGGHATTTTSSGIFSSINTGGAAGVNYGFRVVLVKE